MGRPRCARDQRVRRKAAKDDSGYKVSITRAEALVDFAALLADDLATLAAQSGRAHDACAATHLSQAAHHAWRAAEALCEGALT
jgi:hypothetical protein